MGWRRNCGRSVILRLRVFARESPSLREVLLKLGDEIDEAFIAQNGRPPQAH